MARNTLSYFPRDPYDDEDELAAFESFTGSQPAAARPVLEAMALHEPEDDLPSPAAEPFVPDPDDERAHDMLESEMPRESYSRRQAMEDDAIRAARDSYRDDGDDDALAMAPLIIGALLDAGVNKGRNVAQFAAQGMGLAEKRKNARNDAVRQISAMQLAQERNRAQAERDAFDQKYRTRQMERWDDIDEVARGNLGLRGAGEARRQAEVQRKWGTDSDAAERMADALAQMGVPQSMLQGRSYQELADLRATYGKEIDLAQGGRKNEIAAEGAGMRRQATIDVDLDNEGATSAAAGRRARTIDEATGEYEARQLENKRKRNELAVTEAGQSAGIPGLVVVDDAVARRSLGDSVTRRRLEEGVTGYRGMVEALKSMAKLREQYGTEISGNVQATYDTLKNSAVAGYAAAANSGVLNPSDLTRFSEQIPGLGPGLADVMRAVPGRLGGHDVQLEQLRGSLEATRQQADPKFNSYGFRYDYDYDPRAGAPSAAPPPAQAAQAPYRARSVDLLPRNATRDQLMDLSDVEAAVGDDSLGPPVSGRPVKANDYLEQLRRAAEEDEAMGVIYE